MGAALGGGRAAAASQRKQSSQSAVGRSAPRSKTGVGKRSVRRLKLASLTIENSNRLIEWLRETTALSQAIAAVE